MAAHAAGARLLLHKPRQWAAGVRLARVPAARAVPQYLLS